MSPFRETLICAVAFVGIVFPLRRGRSAWAAPVLLFLAVLLVAGLAFNVANLDTGGEVLPVVPDPGALPPADGIPFPLEVFHFIFSALLAVVVVGVVVLVLRRPKRRTVVRPVDRWDILGAVIAVLMLLSMVIVWPDLVDNLGGRSESGTGEADETSGGGLGWPTAAAAPVGLILVGALFLGIVVMAYVLKSSPFLRASGAPGVVVQERTAAAAAIREAIGELEIGGDVRTAILACFHRFSVLLGRRGVTDQATMTPWEIEVAAVSGLKVNPEAAATLTSLFEEARYSEHTLGEPERERSIRSLEAIRASLEG